MRRWMRVLLLACLPALLLAGCAGVRLVESEVRSYSRLGPVAPGATYRFERLPSQQASPAAQDQLEAMAQKALAKVGLERDDATPRYSVQIAARWQRDPRAPWDDPWPGWGFGPRYGFGPGPYAFYGPGWGLGWSAWDSPYYRREVSVVLRELPGGQVVYETRAFNDGRWSDNENVFPAMFDAALKGFPQPPEAPRRVQVEIRP